MVVQCVFLSCFESDVRSAARILAVSGIRIHHARSTDEADVLLITTAATVLICEPVYLDGTWENALSMLNEVHPLLAPVLLAETVDADTASEALRRGYIETCWKPLEFSKLAHAIRRAHEITTERLLIFQEETAAVQVSVVPWRRRIRL